VGGGAMGGGGTKVFADLTSLGNMTWVVPILSDVSEETTWVFS